METITACENICRDFWWMRQLGPWIGPALIASGTAVAIAFGAYPWQKRLDRELQLDAERRQAYKEFFASLTRVLSIVNFRDKQKFDEALLANREAYNSLIFFAPVDVIAACRKIIDQILKYDQLCDSEPGQNHNLVFNKALEYEKKALQLARQDVVKFDDDAERAVHYVYDSGPKL